MNKLLRFDNKQKFLIFDMETCSTNLVLDNYPWQCGFLIADGKQILETHNYYIHWDDINNKIGDGAKIHTKFDYNKYSSNAQPQDKVLEIFEKYLYDDKYIKLGHNIFHFDIFIHNFWRKVNNKTSNWSYLNNALDTDSIARAWKIGIKSIKRDEWLQSMFKYGNYKEKGMKTNLTALGKEFDIKVNYDNLHDASNDVELNFLVWQQLKNRIDI